MNILKFIKHYYILIILVLILIIGIIIIVINNKNEQTNVEEVKEIALVENNEEEEKNYYYVDIKGAVKKPGVYEVLDGTIINDVINLAGGLKANATTIDINLSKKIVNEMVIYVSTKTEYNNLLSNNENNNQIDKKEITNENVNKNNKEETNITNNKTIKKEEQTITNNETKVNDYNNDTANELYLNNDEKEDNSLVNINSADENTLSNLPGIGASKANKIINYRNENGPFKSIEDIKNVSGIGESLYEKFKDYITI